MTHDEEAEAFVNQIRALAASYGWDDEKTVRWLLMTTWRERPELIGSLITTLAEIGPDDHTEER